ncbi:response regulator [Deinococcus planocerae]|uniref:response regulator n=1 Tax=Deinococcus planocerae TaxID=1737569 RepID=UPI000C7F1B48|nr:response regulator transcription factor [Deinococcus planocerae]
MIRVCLVDDQTLMREGLRRLLESVRDVRVVGEASDAEGAVRAVLDHRPDVLLLDVWMPRQGGLEVVGALRALGCLPATLLLSSFEDAEVLARGKRLGVLGYLLKDVTLDVLLGAVRAAAQGQAVARPLLSEQARAGLGAPPRPAGSARPALTPREREVLGLVASGQSTRDVSRSLGLSEGTVKNHLSNLMGKLEARDRTQAVLRAFELGLV